MQISEYYIDRVTADGRQRVRDAVAVEEPLEIRLRYWFKGRAESRTVAVTMRTPGNDEELALGFLFTEGVITNAVEIVAVQPGGLPPYNEVHVELAPDVDVDWARLERHFYATSSCGVCGKTSLDALALKGLNAPPVNAPVVAANVIRGLPETLRAVQEGFDRTGGLHAAGLFDSGGTLRLVREDVGRHNALDKLIGACLRTHLSGAGGDLLFMSSRASFEILQKALAAGIAVVATVGAPSSLAIDLAERFQMTLLGFVREGHFNIYTGGWRIA